LPTSTEAGRSNKTAGARFKEAFERLKLDVPKVLPRGTPVSQNNVAKEAGCDPSALRRTRFPSLIAEIQHYLSSHVADMPDSARQKLLKQRRRNRSTRETIKDLEKQRDSAKGLLADANLWIVDLFEELALLRIQIDELKPSATITSPFKRDK